MQKITVIFGGTFGLYHGHLKVFRNIENKFNCKIQRTGQNKLTTRINNAHIEFLFGFHPRNDQNYRALKKSKEEGFWKELVPPPMDKVVKRVKNKDKILFLGLCGGLIGKKSDIYTPTEFSEIFFGKKITSKDIQKAKPLHKIKIRNRLQEKLETSSSKAITSNLTIMPNSCEKNSKDEIIQLSQKLQEGGDFVDKECYQIAKHFKNKAPLYIGLMASDVASVKRHMLQSNMFEPNIKKFNKLTRDALKAVLEK